MAKAVAVSWTLFALACSSEPFVIGQYVAPDAYVPAADASPGGGDAGSSDAGAGDAGAGEHDGECMTTYPRALACSQFEASDVAEGWDQVVQTGESRIERTEARSHSGEGALRATTSAATKRAVVVRRLDALYEGELFIRAYLYVPSGVATQTMNIFFVGDDRWSEDDDGVDLNLEGGALQAFLAQESPDRYTGQAAIPRDRWFCFRARIVLDDELGSVEAHADDTLLLEASGLDTVPDRGVRHFRAGIDWSSEQEEFFEVFMDDLVLARTPVHCW
jgi:hypothetical protein